jgi:hypothetical protein
MDNDASAYSSDSWHKGDVVLFVPLLPLPLPRGSQRMYTVGTVSSVHASASVEGCILCIVDLCQVGHSVYERFVQLLSCPHLREQHLREQQV